MEKVAGKLPRHKIFIDKMMSEFDKKQDMQASIVLMPFFLS